MELSNKIWEGSIGVILGTQQKSDGSHLWALGLTKSCKSWSLHWHSPRPVAWNDKTLWSVISKRISVRQQNGSGLWIKQQDSQANALIT